MSLRINSDFNGVTDPDAGAYIAAVEAADGQLLEFAVGKAINDFVIGCKNDGTWNAIKASCILAGARTLTGALVPLAGTAPTNNNFVSGDYNRKTGLIGNGSTKYLDSNRNNNADPQNSQHCSVYMSTAPTSGVSLIGAAQVDTGATNVLTSGSRSRNSAAVTYSAVATAGLVGISRNSSGSYIQRFNGTTATATQNSETPVSTNYLLYARADTLSNGQVGVYSNPRLAFYSIGESLNLALLDTRVTALINALAAAIP